MNRRHPDRPPDARELAAEIETQLEKVFGHVIRENAAYYFRYIANTITATEKRNAVLQALAEQEETLATDSSIVALGRRFVVGALNKS